MRTRTVIGSFAAAIVVVAAAAAFSGYGDDADQVKYKTEKVARGDVRAEEALGALYDAGLGVAPDPVRAVKLFRAAALQGSAAAQLNLAHLYDKGRGVQADPVLAYAWADAAAANGIGEVLIDVNVGLPRCGCPPEAAGRLADAARARGLVVRGVVG